MSTAAPALMTTEELLSLPEDEMERWLIHGELREKPKTFRNRINSKLLVRISQLLANWLERQPHPCGELYASDVGCWLRRNPDTMVGIDVVYISPELAARQTDESTLIEGVPTLVVEILSPNDTQGEIHEKTSTYLEAGVPLVWILDPYDNTVRVYRPDAEPELFNMRQQLSADPHLPGFQVEVEKIFVR